MSVRVLNDESDGCSRFARSSPIRVTVKPGPMTAAGCQVIVMADSALLDLARVQEERVRHPPALLFTN